MGRKNRNITTPIPPLYILVLVHYTVAMLPTIQSIVQFIITVHIPITTVEALVIGVVALYRVGIGNPCIQPGRVTIVAYRKYMAQVA